MKQPKKRVRIPGWEIVLVLAAIAGALLIWVGFQTQSSPNIAPLPESEFSIEDAVKPESCDPSEYVPTQKGSFVAVPCIGIDAPLTQTGAKDGWLTLPDPPWATWYERTAPVGSSKGHSLVASHVDSGQGAAAPFYQLHRISKGDTIYVQNEAGERFEYRAKTLKVHEREEVPKEYFSPLGDPTLVLVTCSGPTIDSGDAPYYLYNLVVTAELVK